MWEFGVEFNVNEGPFISLYKTSPDTMEERSLVIIHDSPHGRFHTVISYWNYTPALLKEIPAPCAEPNHTTLQLLERRDPSFLWAKLHRKEVARTHFVPLVNNDSKMTSSYLCLHWLIIMQFEQEADTSGVLAKNIPVSTSSHQTLRGDQGIY